MEKSEQEKFLEATEDVSILDQPLFPEEEKNENGEETVEEQEQKLKNRREKRLADKLQAERESNIALNARLEAISEAQKTSRGTDTPDYLKTVERIYGSDSPEAIAATELLKTALKGVEESAYSRSLETLREEQRNATEAVRSEEKNLDFFVEQIEDEFNVSLSADQQKGFFRLLERLSPKDTEGNIIQYADPLTTFELYKDKFTKKDSRAKDLSARSLVASGSSGDTKLQDDATVRYLKEQGIL